MFSQGVKKNGVKKPQKNLQNNLDIEKKGLLLHPQSRQRS
jgi:hypothetical protein